MGKQSTCIWSHHRRVFFTLLEHYRIIVYKKKPVLDIKNPTPTN